MKNKSSLIAATFTAVLLPAVAHAQYYGQASTQPPLYPYAVQTQPVYIVQPNGYVIQQVPRANAYGHTAPHAATSEDAAVIADYNRHSRIKTDRVLVEELRRRAQGKARAKEQKDIINTTKIVREEPVVIEKKRYVDDPPRVIERRHYVDDTKPHRNKRAAVAQEEPSTEAPVELNGKPRVIRAEAEVTILGPDRMSIRLFRKSPAGNKANARAE